MISKISDLMSTRPKSTRPKVIQEVHSGSANSTRPKFNRIRPSPFGHVSLGQSSFGNVSLGQSSFGHVSFGFGPGHSAKVHSAMTTRIRPSPFGHDHSAKRLRFRVCSFGFGLGHSAKVHSAMITRIRPRPFGHDHSDSAKSIRPK